MDSLAKVDTEKRREFDFSVTRAEAVERSVFDLIARVEVEVKNDQKAAQTGNICVEFCQLGPDGETNIASGINVTTATWWAIHWHENPNDGPVLLVPVKLLKGLCRKFMKDKRRVRVTGDNGNQSVLVPVAALLPGGALRGV